MTKWALAMPMNCDSLEFLFRIGRASTRLARTRASSLKLREIEAMPVPGLDGVHALQTIDWHRCSNEGTLESRWYTAERAVLEIVIYCAPTFIGGSDLTEGFQAMPQNPVDAFGIQRRDWC